MGSIWFQCFIINNVFIQNNNIDLKKYFTKYFLFSPKTDIFNFSRNQVCVKYFMFKTKHFGFLAVAS